MKLNITKEQRHEIYKQALDIFLRYPPSMPLYICLVLEFISRRQFLINLTEGYFDDRIDISENFPEFYSFKPKDKSDDHGWWPMDSEGYEIRVFYLEKCIELTK